MEQNASPQINWGRLSVRGTPFLWKAFNVRAQRGRYPASSSGDLLKRFEGKQTVLQDAGVPNTETSKETILVRVKLQDRSSDKNQKSNVL